MKKPSTKIAISLLTCNDFNYLKPCLDSLLISDLCSYDFKLFCWDNASTDNTIEYINSLNLEKSITLSKTNQGIVIPRIKLYEQIIKEDFDFLLEIHTDMLFPSLWISSLLKIDTKNTLILMPHIYITDRQISISDFKKKFDIPNHEIIHDQCRQVHPWLIKLKILPNIGGYYDPVFDPHRCEDDDLLYRCIKNNYLCRTTNQSKVLHYGGVTRSKTLKMNNHDSILCKKHNLKDIKELESLFKYHHFSELK